MSPWIVSTAGNLLLGAAGIGTSVLLSRTLGPDGRGILTEAMLWPSLVLWFGGIVNVQTVVYFYSKARRDESAPGPAILGVAFALTLVTATFSLLIALVVNYAALSDAPSYTAANWFALTIPIGMLGGCFTAIFLAENSFSVYWGLRVVNALIYLGVLVALALWGGLDPLAAVFAILSAAVIQTAVTLGIFKRRFWSGMAWRADLVRPMVAYGAKTNLAGLPYQLNVRVDQLAMSLMLPAQVLGYYASAFAWSSILLMLGGGISSVVLTRSAEVDPENKPAVRALLGRFRAAVLAICGLGALILVATPLGIPILFGREFLPSVVPALILCVASIVLNANMLLHELVRGLGFPAIGIRAEVVGLVITIPLLFLLLPWIGAAGAALASLVSYIGVSLVLIELLCRRTGVRRSECLLPRRSDVRLLGQQLQGLLGTLGMRRSVVA